MVSALLLAQWRRRVFAIYDKVRELSATDPELAWSHWHAERSRLYRDHQVSPVPQTARDDFDQIDVYAYNPSMRFSTDIRPAGGETIEYQLGDDGLLAIKPFAKTAGLESVLGSELTLYKLLGYGGGVFLPFKDATSGTSTYGGGRYLLDTIKGADLGCDDEGIVWLDFNFAYSPSCAWSPQFVCPLAPAENRLSTAIEVGEKTPITAKIS